MYSKKYIKKIAKALTFATGTVKPSKDGVPVNYRDANWCIGDLWFSNSGVDVLNSTDTFSDHTHIRKFKFNGNTADLIENAIANPGSSNYHYQKDGPFDNKCLSIDLPTNTIGTNTNIIDCGLLGLTTEGLTISADIKIKPYTAALGGYNGVSSVNQKIFGLVNTADATNYFNFMVPRWRHGLYVENSSLVISDGVADSKGSTKDQLNAKINFLDNEWHHIVVTLGKNKVSIFADGVLISSMVTQHINIPTESRLTLSDKELFAFFNIKNLEVFNREINQQEVLVLLNQQTFNPVVDNGKNDAPAGFNFLEQDNKILAVYADKDGKIGKFELEDYSDLSNTKQPIKEYVFTSNTTGVVSIVSDPNKNYVKLVSDFADLDFENNYYTAEFMISGSYKNNSLNPVKAWPKFVLRVDAIDAITFGEVIPASVLRSGLNGIDIGLTVPYEYSFKTEFSNVPTTYDLVNIKGNSKGKNSIKLYLGKKEVDNIGNWTLTIDKCKIILKEIPKNNLILNVI